MAKLVVQHDEDPAIGIVLELVGVRVWAGKCTECGHPVIRLNQQLAVLDAQAHVDTHVL